MNNQKIFLYLVAPLNQCFDQLSMSLSSMGNGSYAPHNYYNQHQYYGPYNNYYNGKNSYGVPNYDNYSNYCNTAVGDQYPYGSYTHHMNQSENINKIENGKNGLERGYTNAAFSTNSLPGIDKNNQKNLPYDLNSRLQDKKCLQIFFCNSLIVILLFRYKTWWKSKNKK